MLSPNKGSLFFSILDGLSRQWVERVYIVWSECLERRSRCHIWWEEACQKIRAVQAWATGKAPCGWNEAMAANCRPGVCACERVLLCLCECVCVMEHI